MKKYNIFISHSSKDLDKVRFFLSYLEMHALNCWISPRDIPKGIPYARAITEGICKCDDMLVFITHNTLKSEAVLNEIDVAQSKSKRIIPVFLENINLTDEFAFYLKRKQWINAYGNKNDALVEFDKAFGITRMAAPATIRKPSGLRRMNYHEFKKVVLPVVLAIVIVSGMLIYKGIRNNSVDIKETIDYDSQTEVPEKSDSLGHTFDIEAVGGLALPDINSMGDRYYNAGNFELAANCYEVTAEKGDAYGQAKLAWLNYDNLIQGADKKEALRLAELAAVQGNTDGMYIAGRCNTILGWKAEPSDKNAASEYYSKAFEYYKSAAAGGNTDAIFNMALSYINASGVNRNDREGLRLLESIGDRGHAESLFLLGRYHRKGVAGLARDDEKALEYYRRAAELGHAEAQNSIGVFYYKGLGGCNPDMQQAIKWYKLAADQNSASAQYNLGILYREGIAVPKDLTEAEKWFRLAEHNGSEDARKALAKLK